MAGDTGNRPPFKTGLDDFDAIRKRMDEIAEARKGEEENGVSVEPQPETTGGDWAGYY